MIIGVLKPRGMTSHDVVSSIRKITGEKRVGHGGTLDPFAEGVLVIGVSRESTKKLKDILKNTDKEYEATLELGKTSTTGDPEGDIKKSANEADIKSITKDGLEATLKKFIGEIEQTPPAYSAIKIKGKPAYKIARSGEKITLNKRKVFIKELNLIDFDPPEATIRTTVSSGTYIRALVEDIGQVQGVGAYTKRLVRTRVGPFDIKSSKTLEELKREL